MISDAETEFAVLTTEAGQTLLAEVAAVARPAPADLARWRKQVPAEWVAAALRLAEGRRRGAAKFTRADAMWFHPTGLEQATAEPVARHKAARFAGATVADLCCGIGGDALALGASANGVFAVDLDSGMGQRAALECRGVRRGGSGRGHSIAGRAVSGSRRLPRPHRSRPPRRFGLAGTLDS